jgi:ABC-2 type transport system permease protein
MTNLIRAELVRLRTTRLATWLVLSTAAGVLLTVAVAIASAGTGGLAALDSTDGVRNVLNGAASATTMAMILGVVAVTGEFRHRTATTTFLVTPHRHRVVAAKLVTTVLAGLVLAAGAFALTLVVAVPWMATKHVDVSVVTAQVGVVLVGVVAATMLYAAIGVGLGALLANQTLAVTVAVIWTAIVEGLLVSLAPGVGRWLPGGASSALTNATTTNGGLLPMWAGAIVLTGYAAAFTVTGARSLQRRDVP